MATKFDLTFWGGAASYFPRYKRWHKTREEAAAEVRRVERELVSRGLSSTIGAHAPIIAEVKNTHPMR